MTDYEHFGPIDIERIKRHDYLLALYRNLPPEDILADLYILIMLAQSKLQREREEEGR